MLIILESQQNLRELAMQAKSKLEFLHIAKRYYENIPVDELQNADPYALPFDRFFTPIEQEVWCFIRIGGLPFHPEYPVLNFFIDFADPVRKIGIECDGKEFHSYEKDFKRDEKLTALGWKIFRISGEQIYRRVHSDILDEAESRWNLLSPDCSYYDFRRNYFDEQCGYSLNYGTAIIENIAHDFYNKDIILL